MPSILPPRPADGTGTNPLNPDWGATGSDLVRLAPDDRGPNGEMSGDGRPGAREISNAVNDQRGADLPNAAGASDFLWLWGQFVDHDLSLTPEGHDVAAPIPVPTGDPDFDPMGTGTATIPFTRATPSATGYANTITAFIDASMVYGSDAATLASMRVEGGKLAMTEESLLKFEGVDVLTGDTRAAENVALMSMHTLFTREHNRMVDELAAHDPSLDADQLFDAARARVEALVQAVTYTEFLPLLLGPGAIGGYGGFDPDVNPQVSAEFSTGVYRLGHTLLSGHLRLVTDSGATHAIGDLALRDAFFRPSLVNMIGIEPVLLGAATQRAQELDTFIVEDVRSFLFGPPGAGGLDLAALNIQRGRDLGIASYVDLRAALGLAPVTGFDDITSDAALAARLEAVYGDVSLVDPWIGGLAEDRLPGGLVGETFATVLVDQFTRARAGDPFWSETRGFTQAELDELWSTRLSDIVLRNSDIREIQSDIFKAMTRIVGDAGSNSLGGTGDADFMSGRGGRDYVRGAGGDDELRGGADGDWLLAGPGDDLALGHAGPDVLVGGNGADRLSGGLGPDVVAGNAGDDILDGDAGNDRLFGQVGHDSLRGGTGSDRLSGGGGDDRLIGNAGHDRLIGGPGDDLLDGQQGNDRLRGGTGADRLFGRDSADVLIGHAGDDEIHGGSGHDTLIGGIDADTFFFSALDWGDNVVRDYEPGVDRVRLSNADPAQVRIEDVAFGQVLHVDDDTSVTFVDVPASVDIPLEFLF